MNPHAVQKLYAAREPALDAIRAKYDDPPPELKRKIDVIAKIYLGDQDKLWKIINRVPVVKRKVIKLDKREDIKKLSDK